MGFRSKNSITSYEIGLAEFPQHLKFYAPYTQTIVWDNGAYSLITKNNEHT